MSKRAEKEAVKPRLLTFQEAMTYLNVRESWLRRARAERRIPAVKLGHLVYFRREDLDAHIEDNLQPAGR